MHLVLGSRSERGGARRAPTKRVLRNCGLNGYYDISLADRKEFDARRIFAEKDASFNFSSVFGRYPRKMALHNGSITPRYVRI